MYEKSYIYGLMLEWYSLWVSNGAVDTHTKKNLVVYSDMLVFLCNVYTYILNVLILLTLLSTFNNLSLSHILSFIKDLFYF